MHCPNCRAALPPGSRFCNGCGAAIGAPQQQPGPARTTAIPPQAYAQPVPPGGQRTQAYQQPGYQQPPPGYQQPPPGYQQPGYAQMPPPVEGRKKPVLLLSALLLLLVAGVVVACVAVAGGFKARSAVTGDTVRGNKSAPGVALSTTPGSPTAPNIGVANRPNSPVGPNAVQAPGKSDIPAPNMILSQNGRGPGVAPSAVLAPTPGMPTAPSVVTAPNVKPPTSPNTTLAPNRPLQGPGNIHGPGAPPPPRTNSEADNYLAWLRWVESERAIEAEKAHNAAIRNGAQGLTSLIREFSDPDGHPERLYQEQLVQFNDTLRRIAVFNRNVIKTCPPVPIYCQRLHAYYMDSLSEQEKTAQRVVIGLQRQDVGTVEDASKRGMVNEKNDMRLAEEQLQKVLATLPPDLQDKYHNFHIEQPGGAGGILSGLGL